MPALCLYTVFDLINLIYAAINGWSVLCPRRGSLAARTELHHTTYLTANAWPNPCFFDYSGPDRLLNDRASSCHPDLELCTNKQKNPECKWNEKMFAGDIHWCSHDLLSRRRKKQNKTEFEINGKNLGMQQGIRSECAAIHSPLRLRGSGWQSCGPCGGWGVQTKKSVICSNSAAAALFALQNRTLSTCPLRTR